MPRDGTPHAPLPLSPPQAAAQTVQNTVHTAQGELSQVAHELRTEAQQQVTDALASFVSRVERAETELHELHGRLLVAVSRADEAHQRVQQEFPAMKLALTQHFESALARLVTERTDEAVERVIDGRIRKCAPRNRHCATASRAPLHPRAAPWRTWRGACRCCRSLTHGPLRRRRA